MGEPMRKYIPYTIIAVLIIALLYQCERSSYYKDFGISNSKALTDTVSHFTNKLGTQTATIRTLQGDKQYLQAILIDKDEELKALVKEFHKVQNIVKAGSTLKIDSIGVKFDEPIVYTPCDSIKPFERSGVIKQPWYRLGYKVTNESLVISPFETWTETTVITGYKRKWFLGEQTVTTDVTNSNPYITVTDLKAANVVIPEPWYRKWYVWLAAGVAGGLLIK